MSRGFGVQKTAHLLYRVMLRVPVDSSLIIEPSVTIVFDAVYNFYIEGTLSAVGTETDTISFITQDSFLTNLFFENISISIQDSSIVNFCKFDQVGIYCESSSEIEFENCTIINGEGFKLFYSSPLLNNLIVRNNFKDDYGGGIYCYNSTNIYISNSLISSNEASTGGGIAFRFNSTAYLNNVTILENQAQGAGGILCDESNIIIENVDVCNNISEHFGAGVGCLNNSNMSIFNAEISSNSSVNLSSCGGGIWGETNSSISIDNSIIDNNQANCFGGGIYFYNSSNLLVTNSIISNNSGGISEDSGGLEEVAYQFMEQIIQLKYILLNA